MTNTSVTDPRTRRDDQAANCQICGRLTPNDGAVCAECGTGATLPTLYHYTCLDHGLPGIQREGLIRPGRYLGVQLPQAAFAWFTDLETPDRAGLGLMPVLVTCDRIAARYTVRHAKVMPWMTVRRALPRDFVDMLETTPGAMPAHWWVAAEPIPYMEGGKR